MSQHLAQQESTSIQRFWVDYSKVDDADLNDDLDNTSQDTPPVDRYLNKKISWASPVSSMSEDRRLIDKSSSATCTGRSSSRVLIRQGPSLMTDSRLRVLRLLNCVGGSDEYFNNNDEDDDDDTHESSFCNSFRNDAGVSRSTSTETTTTTPLLDSRPKKPASILLKRYDNSGKQSYQRTASVACSFSFEEDLTPRSLSRKKQRNDSERLESVRMLPSPVAIMKEPHNNNDLLAIHSDTEESTADSDDNDNNTHRRYNSHEQVATDDDDDDSSNVSIITAVELDALEAKTQDLVARFRYLRGKRASPLPIRKSPRPCVSFVRSKLENHPDSTQYLQPPPSAQSPSSALVPFVQCATPSPSIGTNHQPGTVPTSAEEESQSTASSSLTVSTVSAADWSDYLHSSPKPSSLCIDVSPSKQQPRNISQKVTMKGKRKSRLGELSSVFRRNAGWWLVFVVVIPAIVSSIGLSFYWTRIDTEAGSASIGAGFSNHHDDDGCAAPIWLQLESVGGVHVSCLSKTHHRHRLSNPKPITNTGKKWGR